MKNLQEKFYLKYEELRSALLEGNFDACQLSSELRDLKKGFKIDISKILSREELKLFYINCWMKGIKSGKSYIKLYFRIKNYLDFFECVPLKESVSYIFCQYLKNCQYSDYAIHLFYEGEKIKCIQITKDVAEILIYRYNKITWNNESISPGIIKALIHKSKEEIYLLDWDPKSFRIDLGDFIPK